VTAPPPAGRLATLVALLRGRCPRCRQGRIFRGHFAMNDPCPVCGLIFQREEGSFLGAMYFSYFLAATIIGGVYFAGWQWLPGWGDLALVGLAVAVYLPLVPAVFRYSRILWIYFDRWLSPGDTSAGAFEKQRYQEQHEPPTES
jgi:uncharacterized protein (DUF983 family)